MGELPPLDRAPSVALELWSSSHTPPPGDQPKNVAGALGFFWLRGAA